MSWEYTPFVRLIYELGVYALREPTCEPYVHASLKKNIHARSRHDFFVSVSVLLSWHFSGEEFRVHQHPWSRSMILSISLSDVDAWWGLQLRNLTAGPYVWTSISNNTSNFQRPTSIYREQNRSDQNTPITTVKVKSWILLPALSSDNCVPRQKCGALFDWVGPISWFHHYRPL